MKKSHLWAFILGCVVGGILVARATEALPQVMHRMMALCGADAGDT